MPRLFILAVGTELGEVVLTLAKGSERLRLHLHPPSAGHRGLVATERLVVTHHQSTPVDSDERRRLVTVLAQVLDAAIAAATK